MDPSNIKKLKRVAMKTSMAKDPLSRPKNICLVSCSCPSIRIALGAEGVALALPSKPLPAIAPMARQLVLAPKVGLSLSTPQPKGAKGKSAPKGAEGLSTPKGAKGISTPANQLNDSIFENWWVTWDIFKSIILLDNAEKIVREGD